MRCQRGLVVISAALALWSPLARADAREQEPRYSPWQSKRHTWFAASASDVGVIYARPHLTLGWGAPFWQFVGIDAYGIATNSFMAGYAGWRASLPWLDVQWGYRAVYPWDRRYLPKQTRYEPADLILREPDQRSTYGVIELELTPLAPLLHGVAFAELHPMWILSPSDKNLYEEVMRAVIEPPFAMRTRLGYLYGFGASKALKLGAMVEYLVTPGRPKNVTRVGPVLVLTVTQYLEVLFTTTVTVSSADQLGLYEGSYGFLGLRARWAERLPRRGLRSVVFTESSMARPFLP